jgi:hypothetical protein
MSEDIDNGNNQFDLNFAQGGSFDEGKEVTPSFDHSDATEIVLSDYSPSAVTAYLVSHADSEAVLRVTFDMTSAGGSLYNTARFGILESADGKTRSFIGTYETSTGGIVTLINIALDGQTVGALARAINQYAVANAEVLNNRYDLSVNCIDTSPFQNGTNNWAQFFRAENCGQSQSIVVSTLTEDIKFYYTSVEPELAQSNPIQSLGGFVSPTLVYVSAKLVEPLSFNDTYLLLDDDNLTGYSLLQIGDELVTIKEWKETNAVIESRHAYGTPIRYHPIGQVVRGVTKNDLFNRVFNADRLQYRCIAIKNTSSSEIARDVKVFFKLASRNTLSRTRFSIEIPKSEYYGSSATSGSLTTVVDSSLVDLYEDDYFVGAPLTIVTGNSAGQTRLVTDYDGSSGKFTLESELPHKAQLGNTFKVNTSPAQIIPSGTASPNTSSTNSGTPPYLITAFQSATFATNGISIDVGGNRPHGSDLYPNEVIYVWLERHIDDNNDEFLNSRAIVSLSFSRA